MGLNASGAGWASTSSPRSLSTINFPSASATDPLPSERPVGDGIVRVSRETKGRAGRAVTVVRGLMLDDAALAALGKRLRTACGSGGTVKDGMLEIQGAHAERVRGLLAAEGFVVKRAGA